MEIQRELEVKRKRSRRMEKKRIIIETWQCFELKEIEKRKITKCTSS